MYVCVHVAQGCILRRYNPTSHKKPYYKAELPLGFVDDQGRPTRTFTFCEITGEPRSAELARAEAEAWLLSFCQAFNNGGRRSGRQTDRQTGSMVAKLNFN